MGATTGETGSGETFTCGGYGVGGQGGSESTD